MKPSFRTDSRHRILADDNRTPNQGGCIRNVGECPSKVGRPAVRRVPHAAMVFISLLSLLVVPISSADAAPVDLKWRDFASVQLSGLGFDRFWLFTIDTEIVVSDNVLKKGESATFDYTQTYSMMSDPQIFGLNYGSPEMVPGNDFLPPGPALGDLLYSLHFQHDLFLNGCATFTGLSASDLKTNSPAPGGINTVTIGPIGIGGQAQGTGDTNYTAHLLGSHAWIDWNTSNTRAGFFFDASRIHLSGTLMATMDSGTAELFTDNKMRFSGSGSVFPLIIITNPDTLARETRIRHGVTLFCVPEPNSLVMLTIGSVLVLGMGKGIRARGTV